MTFQERHIEKFKTVFETHWKTISGFPGCTHLELLQDAADPSIFFTHSHWNSPEDLENYRRSEFFKGVWSETKSYFAASPQAWSVKKVQGMPSKPIT